MNLFPPGRVRRPLRRVAPMGGEGHEFHLASKARSVLGVGNPGNGHSHQRRLGPNRPRVRAVFLAVLRRSCGAGRKPSQVLKRPRPGRGRLSLGFVVADHQVGSWVRRSLQEAGASAPAYRGHGQWALAPEEMVLFVYVNSFRKEHHHGTFRTRQHINSGQPQRHD